MMSKREMERMVLRMLKSKVTQEPEIRDRQFSVFTAAYHILAGLTSQYVGKTISFNGLRIPGSEGKNAPRNCEIYDLRIGLTLHEDGWIDGTIIAQTDCLYTDTDEAAESESGYTPLELALGNATKATFTAIEGRDSFEMRILFSKVCKTSKCAPAECVSINLAGTSTVEASSKRVIKDSQTVCGVRYVSPDYDLTDWVFNPFFETLVENGLKDADEFTESDLYGQVLVDASNNPVAAIIYASDSSVTFDASTLAMCIGEAKTFTVIAHDTGVVEVQFEHGVEYVNKTTGAYEMKLENEQCGGIAYDVAIRTDLKALEKHIREILDKQKGEGT